MTAEAPAPSPFVVRSARWIPPRGAVLDVACGAGRHARWLAAAGHPVVAVDRDPVAIAALREVAGVDARVLDLEGDAWPLGAATFAAVVVTNYLFRPHLAAVCAAVAPGGVLIYETFARGNEVLGRPQRSEFLLEPGELLDRVRGAFEVIAYEHGRVATPRPAIVQRIAAVRGAAAACRLD